MHPATKRSGLILAAVYLLLTVSTCGYHAVQFNRLRNARTPDEVAAILGVEMEGGVGLAAVSAGVSELLVELVLLGIAMLCGWWLWTRLSRRRRARAASP
jgi:hypothetical protein